MLLAIALFRLGGRPAPGTKTGPTATGSPAGSTAPSRVQAVGFSVPDVPYLAPAELDRQLAGIHALGGQLDSD